jgi:xylulose-5-phosphate/fructose-6-phosphate phosphoketolase
MAEFFPEDRDGGDLAPDGRVMEMLSEHTLEGWLEAYLLSGRHGFLSSYEALVHVIDSMFNQHCKWLEISRKLAWRRPISSLNLLITSTVWRQDHNGFTHQDPGFLDVVANKSAEVTRIYLPPDVNCLLSIVDHCLRSTDYVNVIVSDKQLHLQYLDKEEAIRHCIKGIGIWDWASTDEGYEPDAVLVGCGDIATSELLAASVLLRDEFPDLRLRFINVVDLFRLEPATEHPHSLSDRDFDGLFTKDKPVIFNFHGYPWLIHRLAYRRTNHHNFHVRGYREKGNINTPLELAILNQTDRFTLAIDVIDRVPKLQSLGAHAKERFRNQQLESRAYAYENGIDKPEIVHWKWTCSYVLKVLEIGSLISGRVKASALGSWLERDSFLYPLFRTSILHRAALSKGIVPGKSLFQQVRRLTTSLQRPLKVVAKAVPVNWMGTVVNNGVGALPQRF